MSEENTRQEFRLENIDETRNYFVREIDQNELISKKNKKVCRVMNNNEPLLILISGCVSISAFTSLVGIPTGIMSSAIGLKICVITEKNEKVQLISKSKIVFLAKSKLNSVEVLISKALIDSNTSHDEFFLINNVLNKFYDMKEEIKNSNDK